GWVLVVRTGGWQAKRGLLPVVMVFPRPGQTLYAVARSSFSVFAFAGVLCCASAGPATMSIDRPAAPRMRFRIHVFLIGSSCSRSGGPYHAPPPGAGRGRARQSILQSPQDAPRPAVWYAVGWQWGAMVDVPRRHRKRTPHADRVKQGSA